MNVCPQCEKGFSTAGNLKEHIAAVHEGKKPHVCPQCDTAFSQASTLKRHVETVPLNNESDYDGGRLVFATKEGLVWPSRKAGSATLHDSSIAHGVSLHTRGVRATL
ncbi:hypothetical protein T484DRAFT_1778017 [Baffinella frigidus]|nr:hypothetical protein T484DRAFT_1778017 [Cryptophyta sp. CCMP2293]